MADQIMHTVVHEGKEKPLYWHEHEVHKAAEKAANALFDLQNLIQKVLSTDTEKDDYFWREVYRVRCDIGKIEHAAKLRLGYKDGLFSPANYARHNQVNTS